MSKSRASGAILKQLHNDQATSIDSQMVKVIMLKRVVISVLSGIFNTNSDSEDMLDPFNMANLLAMPPTM